MCVHKQNMLSVELHNWSLCSSHTEMYHIVYYIMACLLQFILNCGKIESFTFEGEDDYNDNVERKVFFVCIP